MTEMTRIHPLSVPIKEQTLKLIETKFEGKTLLKFNEKYLKKDLVVYLVFYLTNLQFKYIKQGNAFPLSTKILKSVFLTDYKPYLVFLDKLNIIICLNDSYIVGKLSRLYAVEGFFSNSNRRKLMYQITDERFLEKNSKNKEQYKLSDYHIKRNKNCKDKRNHLVKSFNNHLNIDSTSAYEEISNLNDEQYFTNRLAIEEYITKNWKYSMKEESDNRLHTVICRTKKNLLKYITYKNKRLGEIDIKTSQPLFFYITMKTIFDQSVSNELKKFLDKKLGKELQGKINQQGIDFDELNKFGEILIEGDLYLYLAEKIKIRKKPKTNEYYYYIFGKGTFTFDTKRDLMKEAVMRALYGGKGEIVDEVKASFPSIFKIVKIIDKEEGFSSTKNNLSNILQNLEAHIVLDLIAKDISDKFRNIPLLSKHDSLITYDEAIEEVRVFTQKKFEEYTGVVGDNIFSTESW